MGEKLSAFLHSVGIRLVVPVSITVAVVLTVHAMLSFRSMQEHFLGFVRTDVQRTSDLIKRATHDGMLLNRLDEVQATIERLGRGPEVAAIRVYDKDGTIVLSAHQLEIGRRIALDSDTCRSCHEEEQTKIDALLERSSLARVPEGLEVLRHLTVITKLDVEMSMSPLAAAIGSAQMQIVWTTIVLILIIGVVAGVFVHRVVNRPVFKLFEGTRRVAGGDLDTTIDVRGGHELAQLAEAFNRMVSDLRTARGEVTEWSHKLEEKVVEKTGELRRAQHQVLHMEKMASLGKLSASVAHELNNPLGGMLTYARLVKRELREQPLKAEVLKELERYLSLTEQECARCGTIVNNLLIFARRSGMEMAPIDLNEVVERSLMLIRHHLEISSVELRSELLPGDTQIVADADQLQQALVAIFVNAVEAMSTVEDRAGELTVRLHGEADEVQIEIGDNGAGIPPEALPHIFEPFFSTKAKESGVGLGLAVVYGIVHRHDGTIEVDSEPGRGTTFRLRLPRESRAQSEREHASLETQTSTA
ncbi:MAG: sensor histidine kinase [Planctomycetota bacterium]|jgi:two-component system NtrC family sensor kinase